MLVLYNLPCAGCFGPFYIRVEVGVPCTAEPLRQPGLPPQQDLLASLRDGELGVTVQLGQGVPGVANLMETYC